MIVILDGKLSVLVVALNNVRWALLILKHCCSSVLLWNLWLCKFLQHEFVMHRFCIVKALNLVNRNILFYQLFKIYNRSQIFTKNFDFVIHKNLNEFFFRSCALFKPGERTKGIVFIQGLWQYCPIGEITFYGLHRSKCCNYCTQAGVLLVDKTVSRQERFNNVRATN